MMSSTSVAEFIRTLNGGDLPALSGSEKQVAWAEDIRAKAALWLQRRRIEVAEPARLDEPAISQAWAPAEVDLWDREVVPEPLAAAIVTVIDRVLGRTEAGWWIDKGQRVWTYRRLRKLAEKEL
jgi:hypothetical protein